MLNLWWKPMQHRFAAFWKARHNAAAPWRNKNRHDDCEGVPGTTQGLGKQLTGEQYLLYSQECLSLDAQCSKRSQAWSFVPVTPRARGEEKLIPGAPRPVCTVQIVSFGFLERHGLKVEYARRHLILSSRHLTCVHTLRNVYIPR